MTPTEITRAWKDPRFRATLSADQLASLPENPAGSLDFPNVEPGTIHLTPGDQTTNPSNCTSQPGCTFRFPCEVPPCETWPGESTCGDPQSSGEGECESGAGTAFCGC